MSRRQLRLHRALGGAVVRTGKDPPPFGTLGPLEYDSIEDAQRCHVCGAGKRNLAQHARLAHGLTADAYRELAGLNRQTRLITPTLRARLRETTAPLIAGLRAAGKLRRWDEDAEKLRHAKAAAVVQLRAGLSPEGRQHQHAAMTDERRAARAATRRERNRAGLDQASGAAIAAGLRRAAGAGTCARCGQPYERTGTRQRSCAACRPVVAGDQGREARRRRLRDQLGEAAGPNRAQPRASDQRRPAVCPRCEQPFTAGSHRDKHCPACRPTLAREYGRAWRERWRRARGIPARGSRQATAHA
jgi:hypothetical protein